MALIGRITLVSALLAAPWAFGSVTPQSQWWLGVTLVVLLVWHLIESLSRRPDQAFHLPTAILAPAGLLVVTTIQLLPRDEPPVPRMGHAVFAEWADAFAEDSPAAGSVSPTTTRTQAALLFFGLSAFYLGARWFSTDASQIWLWRLIALNGAALGFFGIVQKLTWNGLLYWSVPLRLGGTPFASFVNRNNAAGYLNLCLGAGLGWLLIRFGSQIALNSQGSNFRQIRRLPWKARALRRIAAVDGRELGLAALIIVISAAVLFSLSRGGILAMVVGLGASVCRQRGFSRVKGIAVVLFLSAAAAGTLIWIGGWDSVRERLASLGDPAAATEGRLVHWRDTSGAVLDFPMLGTGLGTYRYANLPYQRHQGDAWYVNADNHYFEMLVETGVIGLVLYLFGFAATGLAAGYLMRSDRLELRTAGIVGMFITASQAVQALTDFGLLIPANALTFAVLSGSVCGAACRAANAQRLHVPWRLGIARLEGRWSQAMLPFVLTSASFAFGLELYAAMRAASAGNVLIEIDPSGPLETRPERLEAAIEQAEHALDIRPDDPELHRAVALWWIDRYRLEAARELDRTADPSAKLVGRRLWQATSVGVLSSRALELREEGDGEQLGRLRELPIVREYLIPARDHLLEASWHGPLTRDVSRYLADLTFLSEDSDNSDTDNWAAEMSVDLARALFVTPSSPDRLYDAAIQAEMAGLTPLSDRAFGRCLEISDEYISSVWSIVSEDRPIDELLDRVIPDRLEVLVTLAEQNSDELVKSSLANHASRLLNEGQWENVEEPSRLLQARLAELQGKSEQAIRHYRVASGRQATEIEARFRLARLLLEEGRLEEAESELSLLHRMAENRKDVKSRLDDLKQEWRDTLPHDGE